MMKMMTLLNINTNKKWEWESQISEIVKGSINTNKLFCH